MSLWKTVQPPASHAGDYDLVQRILAKDRTAFDKFFQDYFQRLYRFCRKRVDDPSLCEDLAQETLIKALKGMHRYRGEAALFTWLCQICRHEISGWARGAGVKLEQLTSIDDVAEFTTALESLQFTGDTGLSDATAREQLVHLSLDSLPDRYGDLLEMKYLEGLSVAEIAVQIGTSQTGVQSALARARNAFRICYADLMAEVGVVSGDKTGARV